MLMQKLLMTCVDMFGASEMYKKWKCITLNFFFLSRFYCKTAATIVHSTASILLYRTLNKT